MKLGSSRGMDTKRPRGSERSKPCHQLQLTRRSQPPYPWPPEQAQPGVSKPCRTTVETKSGLDQVVRERAYLLWEQAGRPDGRANDFWHQAQHQRFCERAYARWEREGRPEGKADEHWFRTRAFEEN